MAQYNFGYPINWIALCLWRLRTLLVREDGHNTNNQDYQRGERKEKRKKNNKTEIIIKRKQLRSSLFSHLLQDLSSCIIIN